MRKDFEEREAAIWVKWERKWGRPIPQGFRERFKQNIEKTPGEEGIYLDDLDGLLRESFEMFELLDYFANRKKAKGSASGKRYQRCFEKRLYLVEFVMDRRLTIANWNRRSFALRKRINWRELCEEWNKSHPNDPMSPEVLKVRYYRAIAEEDVKREYFARKDYEESIWWEGLVSELVREVEEGKTDISSLLQRLPEGFGDRRFRKFESMKRFMSEHRNEIKALALDLVLTPDNFLKGFKMVSHSKQEALIKLVKEKYPDRKIVIELLEEAQNERINKAEKQE